MLIFFELQTLMDRVLHSSLALDFFSIHFWQFAKDFSSCRACC